MTDVKLEKAIDTYENKLEKVRDACSTIANACHGDGIALEEAFKFIKEYYISIKHEVSLEIVCIDKQICKKNKELDTLKEMLLQRSKQLMELQKLETEFSKED